MKTTRIAHSLILAVSICISGSIYAKTAQSPVATKTVSLTPETQSITRPVEYYKWTKAEQKAWNKEHKAAFKADKKAWDKEHDKAYKAKEKEYDKQHKAGYRQRHDAWLDASLATRTRAWESFCAANNITLAYPADFDKWTSKNQKAFKKEYQAQIKDKKKAWDKEYDKQYKARKKAWEKEQKAAEKAEKKAWKKQQKIQRDREWNQYLLEHNIH